MKCSGWSSARDRGHASAVSPDGVRCCPRRGSGTGRPQHQRRARRGLPRSPTASVNSAHPSPRSRSSPRDFLCASVAAAQSSGAAPACAAAGVASARHAASRISLASAPRPRTSPLRAPSSRADREQLRPLLERCDPRATTTPPRSAGQHQRDPRVHGAPARTVCSSACVLSADEPQLDRLPRTPLHGHRIGGGSRPEPAPSAPGAAPARWPRSSTRNAAQPSMRSACTIASHAPCSKLGLVVSSGSSPRRHSPGWDEPAARPRPSRARRPARTPRAAPRRQGPLRHPGERRPQTTGRAIRRPHKESAPSNATRRA